MSDVNNKHTAATSPHPNYDPSTTIAEPVTLQSCQCPHLTSLFPQHLDTTTTKNNKPIHRLHVSSHVGGDLSDNDEEDEEEEYMYGEEEAKLYRGMVENEYCPLIPEWLMDQQQRKKGVWKVEEEVEVEVKDNVDDEKEKGDKQQPQQEEKQPKKEEEKQPQKEEEKQPETGDNPPSDNNDNDNDSNDQTKYQLSKSRYEQLHNIEQRIRNETIPPSFKRKSSKPKPNNNNKWNETSENELLNTTTALRYWETMRQNRTNYWNRVRDNNNNRSELHCTWCKATSPPWDDDELLQCLECSLIGCGPCSISVVSSRQHLLRHFLVSGHSLGMTCGKRGTLFCMRCGDFVYHTVFSIESFRIEIEFLFKEMSWTKRYFRREMRPSRLRMSWDDRRGVIWNGMMGYYPYGDDEGVKEELVMGAWMALKRLKMFRGELERSLDWGFKALEMGVRQSRFPHSFWKISAPIGLYNLGNTCFMGCILQCLLHCPPLQSFFLQQIGHCSQTCELLRRAAASSSSDDSQPQDPNTPLTTTPTCFACEMDRLFLETFGNTIDIPVLDVLDGECSSLLPHRTPTTAKQHEVCQQQQQRRNGTPLIPTRLLIAVWKMDGMKHLAGYEQRDAHEFLQSFLDRLAEDLKRFRRLVVDFGGCGPKNEEDMIHHLFGGALRSVLICTNCNSKRSQIEPFLILSLPISSSSKHHHQHHHHRRHYSRSSSIGTRTTTAHPITLTSCLEQFTSPETLADTVYCPFCTTKTNTMKQQTILKLPRVLCFHLKRFDAQQNKKIGDPVWFPGKGLDMGMHLPHWCEVVRGQPSETNDDNVNDNDDDDNASSSSSSDVEATHPRVYYDLISTVNHTGTLHQGHYVSNVKVDDKWYHCNDAFVGNVAGGEKEILGQMDGAYILFYGRRM